jgi:hypothetical protein
MSRGRWPTRRLVGSLDWFGRHRVDRSNELLRHATLAAIGLCPPDASNGAANAAASEGHEVRATLVERMRESTADDVVRVAAFPSAFGSALGASADPELVRGLVASIAEVAVSPRRTRERQCIERLLALEEAAAEGASIDEATLEPFLTSATLLVGRPANHLGIDLLASAYRLLSPSHAARTIFASLHDALVREIAGLDPSKPPPAPIWCAWSRLAEASEDPRALSLAADIASRVGPAKLVAPPRAEPASTSSAPAHASTRRWYDDVRLHAGWGRGRRFLETLATFASSGPHHYVLVLDEQTAISEDRWVDLARRKRHHVHARLVAGRLELESGVWLSRYSVERVLAASRTELGQRLVRQATDVGVALAALIELAGFVPTDEEHYCAPLARASPSASLRHAFLPGPSSPTLLGPRTAESDPSSERDGSLHPKVIWPTDIGPSTRDGAHHLNLVAGIDVLHRYDRDRGENADAIVVSVVRDERVILPHFLEHYRRLGVRTFAFVDNASTDGTREYLIAQPDVILYATDAPYKTSRYGVVWQQTILANHCLGRWVVLADADEFLVYPDFETVSLRTYLDVVGRTDADAVLLGMIDMYPFGDLQSADLTLRSPFEVAPWFDRAALTELSFGGGHFSNSRNFVSTLRHRVAPSRINAYVSQKYAVVRYRPWMCFSEGLHFAANIRTHAEPAYFAHFKYHAGFAEKVATEVRRKQHFNGAEEYQRYASMLQERAGGFGDDQKSARFVDSRSFSGLLPGASK